MNNWITEKDGQCIIRIRVIPRASRNEIQGIHDDALKIKLQAPPLEGRANKALARFLSKKLNTSPSKIEIRSGASGRLKRVRVTGMSAEQVISITQRTE